MSHLPPLVPSGAQEQSTRTERIRTDLRLQLRLKKKRKREKYDAQVVEDDETKRVETMRNAWVGVCANTVEDENFCTLARAPHALVRTLPVRSGTS